MSERFKMVYHARRYISALLYLFLHVYDRYCVPGSEREKLTEALKRIAPQAVGLSSPDWWLHNQFMVSSCCCSGSWYGLAK